MAAVRSLASVCSPSEFEFKSGRTGIVAKLAQPIENCTLCGDLGAVRATEEANGRTYAVMKRCPRSIQVDRVRRFNEAALPAKHWSATFATFVPGNAVQVAALSHAREFANGTGRGFGISGPPGTGKTHLLVATLRHMALEAGARIGYVDLPNLFANIKDGFDYGSSEAKLLMPLLALDVLAIDELARGRMSEFDVSIIDRLIGGRYLSAKPTIFATNYRLSPSHAELEIPTRQAVVGSPRGTAPTDTYDLSLEQRVGAHTYSRLTEMCELIQLPMDERSNDYRRNPPVRKARTKPPP